MSRRTHRGRPAGKGAADGRFLAFLFVSALLPVCPHARSFAAEGPSRDMRGTDLERPAYVAMVLADQALGEGDRARAAAQYQEALNAFIAIRREHPEYKGDAIGFRMKYCQDRLAEIVQQWTSPDEPPAAPAPPAGPDALPPGPAVMPDSTASNAAPAGATAPGPAPAGETVEDEATASLRQRAEDMVRRLREERARARDAESRADAAPGPARVDGTETGPARERDALEQKIIGLSAATNEAGRARAAAEERVRELTSRAEAAEADLRRLKDASGESASRLAAAEEKAAEAARQAEDARRAEETMRASLASLGRQCEELGRERDELREKLARQPPPPSAAERDAAGRAEAELAALRRRLEEASAERDRFRGELAALRAAPAPAPNPLAEGARADEQFLLLQRAVENRDRENLELKAKVGRLEQDLAAAGLARPAGAPAAGADVAAAVKAERERVMRLFADEKEALLMAQKVLEQQVQSLLTELQAAKRGPPSRPRP